jgi:rhodanese-related sulfurtransferase
MTIQRISPAEAHAKVTNEGFTYIDVRTPEEFREGRPAGSINLPLGDDFVQAVSAKFGKDARIVVGCKAGGRSLRAATALVAAGFTNVFDQRAGFDGARSPSGELEPGWSRTSLPQERG